jgi:N-acetyl-gamma-glutamyl-phosphate/LysW-gamma-L-alpha-aminoadipyl-6-phosphate reductase
MRTAIVGATGYVGSELVRWLLAHPQVELACVASSSRAGERLAALVPALEGCTDLVLQPIDPEVLCTYDVVLLATPHGSARALVAQLERAPLVIDASADHRGAPGWVYGPPELVPERYVPGTPRVAAPGCFATAIELAVAPFVRAGAVAGPVYVHGATGSTGSGASPSAGTHHPERAVNLKAYKVLAHQHVPEVLSLLGSLGEAPALHFVPTSAPVDRGIFVTAFVPLAPGFDASSILRDQYAGAPLVRLRSETPELRHVRGTAFADLAVHSTDGLAVVLVAIDNLGKGAASQVVQCLNLVSGLPQQTGLLMPACTP